MYKEGRETYFSKHSYKKKCVAAVIAIVLYAILFWHHIRLPLIVGGETKGLIFIISGLFAFVTLYLIDEIPFPMEVELWEYPDRDLIGVILKKERKIITPIIIANNAVLITCLIMFVKTLVGHCPAIIMALSTGMMVVVAVAAAMNDVYFIGRRKLCVALATS